MSKLFLISQIVPQIGVTISEGNKLKSGGNNYSKQFGKISKNEYYRNSNKLLKNDEFNNIDNKPFIKNTNNLNKKESVKLPNIFDEINKQNEDLQVFYMQNKVLNENIFKKKKKKQMTNSFHEMNKFNLDILNNKNWGNTNNHHNINQPRVISYVNLKKIK